LSGINLYTTYTQYEALYKNVNNEKTRIGLPVEDSENANKNISQQVTNVFNNYFVIFKNALAVILNNNSILFSQSPINTRPTDLN